MFIYLLFDWLSGENYAEDDRPWQIKKKQDDGTISDVFTYHLNLKRSASLFFLTKDNFMFWIKSLFFSFNVSH